MRLLIASTWWPCPPDNGSRLRAYHLTRYLAQRHQVTLVAFDRADSVAAERDPLDGMCRAVHQVPLPPGARGALGIRGLMSRVPRSIVQRESPPMRLLMNQLSRSHDVAVALQLEAAWYLADQVHIPRVFEEVEIGLYRDLAAEGGSVARRVRSGLTWAKHRRFLADLVGRFDAATVVSVSERAALQEIGLDASRVSVVPNGVATALRRPRSDRAMRVIYPGSVVYSANLDAVRYFVDEIWPLVHGARPALECWITGTTGDVDVSPLRRPGIVFTGHVPDVEPLVEKSAACIVPLRVGGGTRLKVLQAMALGTPVVSTTKGIEGLEVAAGHHVCVADSATAFADQILHVVDNEGDWVRQMTADARALVETRYQWNVIGSVLEDVIEGALASFGAGGGHASRRAV
jgi:glycosyltransferase involved in cell wall biosynthesis